MLQPSAQCKALIARFEGYAERLPDGSCQAYPDPASPMGRGKYPTDGPDATQGNPWTIGFGTTGGPDPITRGTIWTLDKAEERLDSGILARSIRLAALLAGHPTTQGQFDAMVSLAYNIGVTAFANSTLLRDHLAGQYAAAADQFLVWNKASGAVVAGLTARRKAERAMYLG